MIGFNSLLFILMMLMGPIWNPLAYSGTSKSNIVKKISMSLDDFHDAASKADFKRYFDHFAVNGVFLGTDATERWSVNEFKKYAKPHFDKGKVWTYVSKSRNILLSKDGNTAWFDEMLENQTLGECRGSGVLAKIDHQWKILQYNLTITIPNQFALKVAEMIKGTESPKK